MNKFLYCFPSIFQFVLPALAVALLTPWLGFHLLHHNLSLFVDTCFFVIYYITWRLAIHAYKEMKQDFAEYNDSEE